MGRGKRNKRCRASEDEAVRYHRTVLSEGDEFQHVQIFWEPGAATKPHHHGNSFGLIRVVEGVIAQHVYDRNTKKHIATTLHRKGDVIFETPDIIHIMRNNSKKKKAITRHYYTPPLPDVDCRYTEEELEQ